MFYKSFKLSFSRHFVLQIRWFSNQLDVWYSETLDYIAVRLYLSTCVINPLMYGIFRRNVRRKIMANTRKLLRKCCCCCKASNKVRPQRTEAERWRTPSTISGSLADSRATWFEWSVLIGHFLCVWTTVLDSLDVMLVSEFFLYKTQGLSCKKKNIF